MNNMQNTDNQKKSGFVTVLLIVSVCILLAVSTIVALLAFGVIGGKSANSSGGSSNNSSGAGGDGSLFIMSLPNKTSLYLVNDTVKTDGLVLGYSKNGAISSIVSGYTVEPAILADSGIQTITVSYNGMTTSFTVNVNQCDENAFLDFDGSTLRLYGSGSANIDYDIDDKNFYSIGNYPFFDINNPAEKIYAFRIQQYFHECIEEAKSFSIESGITEVNLPEFIDKIWDEETQTYYPMEGKNLFISDTVTSLMNQKEDLSTGYAFFNRSCWNSITLDSKNTAFRLENGCLIKNDGDELVMYVPSNESSPKISSSVKKIGDYVFYYNDSITEIKIPDSVTEIGHRAFYADGLKKITIPSSIEKIGEDAVNFYCTTESGGETLYIEYLGTKQQWQKIQPEIVYYGYIVHCSDGNFVVSPQYNW